MLRPVVLAMLAFLLPAGAAFPQSLTEPAPVASPGPALLLTGGYAAFADDGRIDHGAGGAGVEWRVRSHLACGVDLTYMVGPGADRDLFIAAALRVGVVRWDRAVVPYGVLHAGAMAHRDRLYGMRQSDVGMVLQVGGGVRIAAGRRVFIAPEFAIGAPPHIRATLTVGLTLR